MQCTREAYELAREKAGAKDPTPAQARAHGPIDGLEGPMVIRGRLVYWDPGEGRYWEPETGVHLDGG